MNAHDRLNDFVDARQRGARPKATDPDTRFAGAFLDVAAGAVPDRHFVSSLASRLEAEIISPSAATSSGPPVMAPFGPNRPQSRSRRQPQALTWAAVLAAFVLLGTLVLTLSQPDTIRLQPSAIQAATSTPTGQPAAITNPLPVLTGGYAAADEAVFKRMFASGLRWTGLSLTYHAEDADSLLPEAQSYIELANRSGLTVLISLNGTAEAVAGAQADGYAMLAAFAGELAALGPSAIEVWPEANLDLHWPAGKIGGASYAKLLRPVYTAIKTSNPEVSVISGAPAPTSAETAFPQRIVDDDNFYAQMAQAGIADYADCIGAHYVEGVLPPMATSGDPRGGSPTRYLVPMVQRAINPFRETGLPVCLTELGYLSLDGIVDDPDMTMAWASGTTVNNQAQWTAEAIETVARLSSVRVALVMLYRVDPVSEDVMASGYALIRPDGTCAACDAIAKLSQ